MKKWMVVFAVLLLVLAMSGCAPNNNMYIERAAGFWAGLWHGLILVITFIISLFTDNVGIYEYNNTGGWYNFGFVLGVLISIGQCGNKCPGIKKSKSREEKEWDDIGERVEEKVRTGIRKWLDEGEKKDEEWEEIGRKVEEKIKRELRNWAEK